MDNGVYVLQTFGPEFRVVYCQGIDKIFGKFNDETLKWDGNPSVMKACFKDSEVFLDLNLALDKAQELSYDYEYLEDGICVITEFKEIKFNED
jgi:hypothetical protein